MVQPLLYRTRLVCRPRTVSANQLCFLYTLNRGERNLLQHSVGHLRRRETKDGQYTRSSALFRVA